VKGCNFNRLRAEGKEEKEDWDSITEMSIFYSYPEVSTMSMHESADI
jgi:hypothetical protein